MFQADSIELCRRRYSERERNMTGRARMLIQRADPNFPDTIDCFDVQQQDMKNFRNRLNKMLDKSGVRCKIDLKDDGFDLYNCKLTEKYGHLYGINYDPINKVSGNNLGVYDFIEVGVVLNSVMDEKSLRGRVIHKINGEEILVRSPTSGAIVDNHTTAVYDDLKFVVVKMRDDGLPIFFEDIWKPEGKGRFHFWEMMRHEKTDVNEQYAGLEALFPDESLVVEGNVEASKSLEEDRREAIIRRKFGIKGQIKKAEEHEPHAQLVKGNVSPDDILCVCQPQEHLVPDLGRVACNEWSLNPCKPFNLDTLWEDINEPSNWDCQCKRRITDG